MVPSYSASYSAQSGQKARIQILMDVVLNGDRYAATSVHYLPFETITALLRINPTGLRFIDPLEEQAYEAYRE